MRLAFPYRSIDFFRQKWDYHTWKARQGLNRLPETSFHALERVVPLIQHAVCLKSLFASAIDPRNLSTNIRYNIHKSFPFYANLEEPKLAQPTDLQMFNTEYEIVKVVVLKII